MQYSYCNTGIVAVQSTESEAIVFPSKSERIQHGVPDQANSKNRTLPQLISLFAKQQHNNFGPINFG